MTDEEFAMCDKIAWKVAHHYHHPQSIHEVEDLHQLAWLGLLELLAKHPDAPWTWRYMSLRERVSAARRKELHRLKKARFCPLEDARFVTTEDNGAKAALEAEEEERIGMAIASLPDMEYQAVCLAAMGYRPVQVSFGQGSKWLGPHNMSQVLRLGRKRLKGALA